MCAINSDGHLAILVIYGGLTVANILFLCVFRTDADVPIDAWLGWLASILVAGTLIVSTSWAMCTVVEKGCVLWVLLACSWATAGWTAISDSISLANDTCSVHVCRYMWFQVGTVAVAVTVSLVAATIAAVKACHHSKEATAARKLAKDTRALRAREAAATKREATATRREADLKQRQLDLARLQQEAKQGLEAAEGMEVAMVAVAVDMYMVTVKKKAET
jgi:hypothetical protein